MPDVRPGQRRKRAREEDNAAQAPATAGEAAPDEGLLAPDEECSVCLNAFERPTITPCSHWFCRSASTGRDVLPCLPWHAATLNWGFAKLFSFIGQRLLMTSISVVYHCFTRDIAHAEPALCSMFTCSLMTAPQAGFCMQEVHLGVTYSMESTSDSFFYCMMRSMWECRECILAEIEVRHRCPLCRAGITAESLCRGVMPRVHEVLGQAGQAEEEVPDPGAHNQQLTYFESKLNVLLKEVLLS